jgi:hypothetical protein
MRDDKSVDLMMSLTYQNGIRSHSSFNVSAGFARAAFTVWELIVSKARVKMKNRAAGSTQRLKSGRKAKDW